MLFPQKSIPCDGTILGYRLVDGQYQIEPKEADLVRLIYDLYLSGMGIPSISNYLNSKGYKTRLGFRWSQSTVRVILKNYNYTGNLILQKTYRTDHLRQQRRGSDDHYGKYGPGRIQIHFRKR